MKKISPEELVEVLDNLSYCECYDCGNFFFVHELPLGINDPKFCPYCGIDFDFVNGIEL